VEAVKATEAVPAEVMTATQARGTYSGRLVGEPGTGQGVRDVRRDCENGKSHGGGSKQLLEHVPLLVFLGGVTRFS
jgi:hypothetical protein